MNKLRSYSGLLRLCVSAALCSQLSVSMVHAHTVRLVSSSNIDSYVMIEPTGEGVAVGKAIFRLDDPATTSDLQRDEILGLSGISGLAARNYSFSDLVPSASTMTFNSSTPWPSKPMATKVSARPTEVWLMILVGAGLIMFQLRRTQRSLQHRPLAG